MLAWVALGGAAAAHAINWGTTFHRLGKRIPKYCSEATSLGLPMTAEEYAASIAVPEGDNAVQGYIDLAWYLSGLRTTHPDFFAELDRHDCKSGPSPQFWHQYGNQLHEVKARFERIGEYPLFRFNRFEDANDKDGHNNLVRPLKHGYKVMALAIEQLAIDGRFEDALDGLESMRKCLAQGVHEPMLLAWLVDVSCRTYYISTVNFLAKRGFDRPEILDSLEQALKKMPPLAPIRHAFRGEVYFATKGTVEESRANWIRNYPNGLPYPMSLPIFQSNAAFKALRAHDLAWILDAIRRLPPTNEDPMAIAKVFEPKWYSGHWWISPTEAFKLLRHNLAAPILHYRARVALAQAGLDVFRLRLHSGSYPAHLPSTIQPDRYHPIYYERTPNGFKLRSGNFEY